MSEEVIATPVSAESQIAPHIRQNYEEVREQRGLTWDQMAEQFDRDHNGHLLAAWSRERAAQERDGVAPEGIESRGDLDGDKRTADAPKKTKRTAKRGNVPDIDPADTDD